MDSLGIWRKNHSETTAGESRVGRIGMRIVLNFMGFRAGGGLVDARNILEKLPRRAPDIQFDAFVPEGYGYQQLRNRHANLHLHIVSGITNDLRRFWFDNWYVTRTIQRSRARVLFSMGNVGTVFPLDAKQVVMIRQPRLAYTSHELKAMGVEEHIRHRVMRIYVRRSLEVADHVIVQTDTMRTRLQQLYNVRRPIAVIGKAVTSFEDEGEYPEVVLPQHLWDRIKMVYVTRYYGHKNLERACVVAWKLRQRGVPVVLLLTLSATDGRLATALIRRIDEGAFGDAVFNLGRVAQRELPSLYKRADVVFAPSLIESLSATYLEAMRFGRALIVSDRDFAREVCGEAAVYVDPLQTGDMVDCVESVMRDHELRKGLERRACLRGRRMIRSWSEVCEDYCAVLSDGETPRSSSGTLLGSER